MNMKIQKKCLKRLEEINKRARNIKILRAKNVVTFMIKFTMKG